jgi:ubiquitin-protein ligase
MKVKEIRNDPDIFFSVGYYDKKTKNIREWEILYPGVEGTLYEGGILRIKVSLDNYPVDPPQFYFKTKIYHLNADWTTENSTGKACFGQSQVNDIVQLIRLLPSVFNIQNPNSSFYNNSVVSSYKDWKNGKSKEFENKTRDWVNRYAGRYNLEHDF